MAWISRSLICVLCLASFGFLTSDGFAQRFSRGQRNAAPRMVTVEDAATWQAKLDAACQRAIKTAVAPTAANLLQMNAEMSQVVRQWESAARKDFSASEIQTWRERLKINELSQALRQRAPLTAELLDGIAAEMEIDYEGIRFKLFDPLRDAIRRYRTVVGLVADGNFAAQSESLFAHLPQYVAQYTEGTDPAVAFGLMGAIRWMEDMGKFIPAAKEVRSIITQNLSGTNLFVEVSESLISLPFQREVNEEFEVNTTIMDAQVRGSGTLVGQTSARLQPRKDKDVAEVRLVLDSVMTSETHSTRHPVSLDTSTSGTVKVEKPILISSAGIKSQPARGKANLQSQTSNLRINTCKMIAKIVRQIVEDRKPEMQDAAARNAEQRVSSQVDETAAPQLTDLNANFQKILQPLRKTNLFPREWAFGTTETDLWTRMTVMSSWQVATPNAPPMPAEADLVVRLHQSAANNGATLGLAGRAVEEEKLVAMLQERFDSVPEALQRPESEPAWRFSFAQDQPLAFSVADGVVRCVLRIDQFRRDGVDRVPPTDLDIVLAYRVTSHEGKIIWEQFEPIGVLPRGFKQGEQVPARLLASIAPVRERLNAQAPKSVEAQPIELPERFANKKLIPVAAHAENGWLMLGWKLAE